ncbi:DUF1425 domain-containing protein [Aliamphritea spongicola]|uniref:DUF1425 domain-containing protein n=1 Tax=Aliamphritea spongicola TaxID=707589 RepID=UPI00196B0899|nr:DUF1425 domain-containing protein [Aliamphritea spongicola]MBN3563915.1 DUF1425 domain-containing protein [Aliamphritea spongicola]
MNKLFLTLLAGLLLTGCHMLQTQPVDYSHIEFSPGTATHMKVRNITQGRTEGDLLRVAVLVHSSRVMTDSYYFRFIWLDKDGNQVKGLSSRWETLVATGVDDALVISRIASNPDAVDYRLLISDKPGM